MIKHIGRHGDRRVLVLYRTVPDEDHMCLVVYSEVLPKTYHDSIMKVLESDSGQQAQEFADVLFRNLLPDGRNMLETLHREGKIKKVPTEQVIMTPDNRNTIRLDELNKLLKQMSEGEDAVKRMAELDAQRGLRDPAKTSRTKTAVDQVADVITDDVMATNLRTQAERMRREAQNLLAEADRLTAEAQAVTASKDARVADLKQNRPRKTRGKKAAGVV